MGTLLRLSLPHMVQQDTASRFTIEWTCVARRSCGLACSPKNVTAPALWSHRNDSRGTGQVPSAPRSTSSQSSPCTSKILMDRSFARSQAAQEHWCCHLFLQSGIGHINDITSVGGPFYGGMKMSLEHSQVELENPPWNSTWQSPRKSTYKIHLGTPERGNLWKSKFEKADCKARNSKHLLNCFEPTQESLCYPSSTYAMPWVRGACSDSLIVYLVTHALEMWVFVLPMIMMCNHETCCCFKSHNSCWPICYNV